MNEENDKMLKKWQEQVKQLEEFELFLAIANLIDIKKRVDRSNQEFNEALYKECLVMLPKFGVNQKSAADKKNDDFSKWYDFWRRWEDSFSDEESLRFEALLEKKQSVESLLPKKRWNE